MSLRLLSFALVLALGPVDAVGADVGVRASVLGGLHTVGVEAFSPNVELGDDAARSTSIGGSVEFVLPFFGLRVGGRASHHFGETDVETANAAALGVLDLAGTFELDANEFAGYVESHLRFASWSIQDPFLGVGAEYAHLDVDGEFVSSRAARTRSALEGATNVMRVYGVGGVDIVEGFGVVARGGYAFHDGLTMPADALRVTGTPAGARFDYEGVFGSIGLMVRIR